MIDPFSSKRLGAYQGLEKLQILDSKLQWTFLIELWEY